jgi:hypothetical protein
MNMKPPEILSLLEEASGTKLYERKKEGALRTLTKKQTKLDEIDQVGQTRGLTGGLTSEVDRRAGGRPRRCAAAEAAPPPQLRRSLTRPLLPSPPLPPPPPQLMNDTLLPTLKLLERQCAQYHEYAVTSQVGALGAPPPV